jgi:hypothetical protein
MLAKNMVVGTEKQRDVAVKVWREVKETLGERIGSRWKDTVEEKKRRSDNHQFRTLPRKPGLSDALTA